MTDARGTLTREGDLAKISFERRLPFDVETVWASITEPEQRAKWFGPSMIEAKAGGKIEMTPVGPPAPAEQRRITGRVLVWAPPHIFEHEAHQSNVGETIVRYELRAERNVTVLSLTDRLLTPSDAAGYIPGTHAFLDRLVAHLEGEPLPNWVHRYAEVQDVYA